MRLLEHPNKQDIIFNVIKCHTQGIKNLILRV
jgi:hypothetical protein